MSTVITSDKLVARCQITAGAVTVKGQLTLQAALSGETMTVELMRGASTVVATGTISSGGITTGVITGTIAASALADGDNV